MTNKKDERQRKRENEGLTVMGAAETRSGVCVCVRVCAAGARVCVKEHQRNPGKVSSHLQLHPFVFPQLLSFPARLCIYSTQSSSMLASAASVVFLARRRFGEMKRVPFTSP